MATNKLQKEVDVYCAWIDESEERNKMNKQGQSLGLVEDYNEDDEDDEEKVTKGRNPEQSDESDDFE